MKAQRIAYMASKTSVDHSVRLFILGLHVGIHETQRFPEQHFTFYTQDGAVSVEVRSVMVLLSLFLYWTYLACASHASQVLVYMHTQPASPMAVHHNMVCGLSM